MTFFEKNTLPPCLDQINSRITALQSDNPFASVVIPAYNEDQSIVKTLDALSKSKLSPGLGVEIIGVNNASTDETQSLMEACGLRIVQEEKKGLRYARKAGMQVAKGEIIIQLDADTIVPETWLDKHMSHYDNNNVAGVGGGLVWTGYSIAAITFLLIDGLLKRELHKSYFEKRRRYLEKGICPVPGGNSSYRKRLGEEIAIEGTSLCSDYRFYTKLSLIAEREGKKIVLDDSPEIACKTPVRGNNTLFDLIQHRYRRRIVQELDGDLKGISEWDITDAR